MTSKPKAAIYIRTATDEPSTIQEQHKELRALADKHGYDIDENLIYSDIGSAKETGRPGFQKLTDDIRAGLVKNLLVWKTERLARNVSDGGLVVWLIQKGHVQLISTDGIYTPESELLILYVHFGMMSQFSLPKKRKHQSNCDCCCCKSARM